MIARLNDLDHVNAVIDINDNAISRLGAKSLSDYPCYLYQIPRLSVQTLTSLMHMYATQMLLLRAALLL